MFERRRAKKRIEHAEALVADTPDGTQAYVHGVASSIDYVLRSPTTGRAVLAFAIRVREPSRHEPGGLDANDPFDYVELVPFAIEHARLGRVVIDSQFADIALPEHRAEKPYDRHWTDFCDERRLSPSSTGVERPLIAGISVTVLGTATRRAAKPGTEAGFRDAPLQLCLVGDFDHPLLILDED